VGGGEETINNAIRSEGNTPVEVGEEGGGGGVGGGCSVGSAQD